MADSLPGSTAYGQCVNLLITLVREEPPAGEVRVVADPGSEAGEEAPVSFAGWLGLIRVLEAMVTEWRDAVRP